MTNAPNADAPKHSSETALALDRTHSRRAWVTWILGSTIGALTCLVVLADPLDGIWIGPVSHHERLAVVALCLPVYGLCLVVHELGHVAAGVLAGFRFFVLLVGPIRFQRSPSGFGFHFGAVFPGGLARMLPRNDRGVRGRMATFIAGGPLANLLLGLVTLLAGWIWHGRFTLLAPPSHAAELVQVSLVLMGMISLWQFASTILPSTAAGLHSDGMRLVRMTRSGPALDREIAVIVLLGAQSSGVRARDLPATLLERVSAHDDGSSVGLEGKLIGYQHWLDRNEPGRSIALLEDVLAGVRSLSPMMQQTVYAEHAYWLARHAHDPVRARRALKRAGRNAFNAATWLRAEAAVLHAEGRHEAATNRANEALNALEHTSPGIAVREDLVEWIEALRTPSTPRVRHA